MRVSTVSEHIEQAPTGSSALIPLASSINQGEEVGFVVTANGIKKIFKAVTTRGAMGMAVHRVATCCCPLHSDSTESADSYSQC